ncbi:MAG: hypothetical protein ACOWWR_03590 [Eubacteriales bacterium]
MLSNKLSLLILTCQKYSDLWEGHIAMLNANWQYRDIKTIVSTDSNDDKRQFEGISIVEAGKNSEFSDRIKTALECISTDYIFITLDDYFLLEQVNTRRIENLVDAMKNYQIDYLRLSKLPNSNKLLDKSLNLYKINLEDRKSNYYVNLYPGIWERKFLEKTLKFSLNAWQYEVSLTPIACDAKAICVMSKSIDYKILDVVRKGKILRAANKYFLKNPVYTGNRVIMHRSEEWRIIIRTLAKRILPRPVFLFIKKEMIKRKYNFYSPLDI